MSKILNQLKGVISQPDQEIFKIGPDVIQDFIGKVIVTMGGHPDDIENVQVGQDKKRLRILAMINKDSRVFECNDNRQAYGGLTLMGAAEVREGAELTCDAKDVLEEIGYSYNDEDDNRRIMLVTVTEFKKGIEIEFNAEVTMAIITDSDFSDKFFIVDAVEEVFKKKKHNSHKFKDKKKTIVFAKVQRSAKADQGFDPDQVRDWKTDSEDEDDDDDC